MFAPPLASPTLATALPFGVAPFCTTMLVDLVSIWSDARQYCPIAYASSSVAVPLVNCIGSDAKSYTADAITSLLESLMEIVTSSPFHAVSPQACAENATVAIIVVPFFSTLSKPASGVVAQSLVCLAASFCLFLLDCSSAFCAVEEPFCAESSPLLRLVDFHTTNPAINAITAIITIIAMMIGFLRFLQSLACGSDCVPDCMSSCRLDGAGMGTGGYAAVAGGTSM